MKDDEFRNITLSRMELYSLIDALTEHTSKIYDMDIDEESTNENDMYYLKLMDREEKLLKRLEVTLGE